MSEVVKLIRECVFVWPRLKSVSVTKGMSSTGADHSVPGQDRIISCKFEHFLVRSQAGKEWCPGHKHSQIIAKQYLGRLRWETGNAATEP